MSTSELNDRLELTVQIMRDGTGGGALNESLCPCVRRLARDHTDKGAMGDQGKLMVIMSSLYYRNSGFGCDDFRQFIGG